MSMADRAWGFQLIWREAGSVQQIQPPHQVFYYRAWLLCSSHSFQNWADYMLMCYTELACSHWLPKKEKRKKPCHWTTILLQDLKLFYLHSKHILPVFMCAQRRHVQAELMQDDVGGHDRAIDSSFSGPTCWLAEPEHTRDIMNRPPRPFQPLLAQTRRWTAQAYLYVHFYHLRSDLIVRGWALTCCLKWFCWTHTHSHRHTAFFLLPPACRSWNA